jgi:hypothetical protein
MTTARQGLPKSRPCAVPTCLQRLSLLASDSDANVWLASWSCENAMAGGRRMSPPRAPWFRLTEEIIADHARPHQIIRAQDLEGARHLVGVEIAAIPHHVLEISDLTFADKQHELASFSKVHLRRKRRHRRKACVAVPCHLRRGDRPVQSLSRIAVFHSAGRAVH